MVYWSAESLPTKQHCGYCYLPTKQHCGYCYLPTKQYVCQDVPILEDNTERAKRWAKATGWLRVKRSVKLTDLLRVKPKGKRLATMFHSQTNNLFLK